MVEDSGGDEEDAVPGADRVARMFTFAAAAYNLVRMRNLTAVAA